MKHFRKWFLYTLYFLAAVVFFLFVLFPSDVVIDYLADQVRATNPQLDLSVDAVKPMLPPGIAVRNLKLRYDSEPLAELDRIKITPDYTALLSAQKALKFRCTAYQGTVQGRLKLGKATSGLALVADADIEGIRLGDIARISEAAGRRIVGTLAGVVNFNNRAQRMAESQVTISDLKIEMPRPVFNIDQIQFTDIDADLVMEQRRLIIKRCRFKGPQADGSISGSMVIANPLKNSRLDIRGNVKPHHTVLAGLQKLGLFSKKLSADKGFPIRLVGTLENPRYAFR